MPSNGNDRSEAFVDIHQYGSLNTAPRPVRFNRGNGAEAVPGVATPVTADFWSTVQDFCLANFLYRIGLLARSELNDRGGVLEGMTTFHYGRLCAEVDRLLDVMARMPGVNLEALEEQLFGERTGTARRKVRRRYPIALLRSSFELALLPRRIDRRFHETHAWWASRTAASYAMTLEDAARLFDEAAERLRTDLTLQMLVTGTHPMFTERVRKAGGDDWDSSITLNLFSASESMEEAGALEWLWEAAHGRRCIEDVVGRYGFHAADGGELASPSWRSDPAAFDRLLRRYKDLDGCDRPTAKLSDQRMRRNVTRQQALGMLRGRRRRRAERALSKLGQWSSLREQGKTLMQQCVDVARAATLRVGELLYQAGRIDKPEDVFYLHRREWLAHDQVLASTQRELVAHRRSLRTAWQAIALPLSFYGNELRSRIEACIESPHDGTSEVTGEGVSSGRAHGTARVILSVEDDFEFEPGDILVCPTTDPGWAPILAIAGGVVLDLGSVLSHGAIIARELGVPAVAGTTTGTKVIPDGVDIEVNGDSGTVRIISTP